MTNSQRASLVFNSDERSYLNSIAQTTLVADLTRQRILEILSFADSTVNEDDELVVELVSELGVKISAMKDEEWDKLKMAIPFNVPFDSPDDVSPVNSDGVCFTKFPP